jgi:hypothetical protein
MHHELKTEIPYFDAAEQGLKPFEIRVNDRGYQKGDTILSKAWHRDANCYDSTREPLRGTITWVTNYAQKDGWCVFGVEYEDTRDRAKTLGVL